jgi:hypothetical protein
MFDRERQRGIKGFSDFIEMGRKASTSVEQPVFFGQHILSVTKLRCFSIIIVQITCAAFCRKVIVNGYHFKPNF